MGGWYAAAGATPGIHADAGYEPGFPGAREAGGAVIVTHGLWEPGALDSFGFFDQAQVTLTWLVFDIYGTRWLG